MKWVQGVSVSLCTGAFAAIAYAGGLISVCDFEMPNFGQWQVTGNAFGSRPAGGTLPGQQEVSGFEGSQLANSFHNGDGATGTLISPAFTIERNYLNFLIGGGYHPGQTAMNLCIDNQVVRSSTGHDTERLLWDGWDVSEFIGKAAVLEIIDTHTGGWGHILIDQIEQGNCPRVSYTNTPIARAMGSMLSNVEKAAADPTRPVYHFTCPAQWMNDINGSIFYNGYYHIFYQHNPYADEWGRMHWGHARSRDLVNWEHLPIALWPSREKGEEHCFSGCLAVNKFGEPVIYYTSIGHELPEQWAAIGSPDLMSWRKYQNNPILTMSDHMGLLIQDWRDPFIFHATDRTFMVLGGKLREEEGGRAVAAIYETTDDRFLKWEYKGILFRHPNKALQSLECPNFFPLENRFVMLDSPYGPVEYFVGSFDVRQYQLIPTGRGLIDHSQEYYATNILFDDTGRCVLLGWIRGFDSNLGWNGCMSLPRILTIDSDGSLIQTPASELKALRQTHTAVSNRTLCNTSHLLETKGDMLEMQAAVRLNTAKKCSLRVRCDKDGREGIGMVWEKGKLTAAGIEVPIEAKEKTDLRIFLDKSVLEVFVDHGRHCVTKVIRPKIENNYIQVSAEDGEATFESIEIWQMKPAEMHFLE
jgi:beta-fructofuranosidase